MTDVLIRPPSYGRNREGDLLTHCQARAAPSSRLEESCDTNVWNSSNIHGDTHALAVSCSQEMVALTRTV